MRATLAEGVVIPAHPLALDSQRRLDSERQQALSRYYIDAGAGGLAVGVHTTQFAIREAASTSRCCNSPPRPPTPGQTGRRCVSRGLVGRTEQALAEADIALGLGYHAGMVSLAAFASASEDERLEHCARLAERIPLVGFYLQPAVGGVVLGPSFWRRLAALENVVAIKIAPFNRYRTLDVVRGVVEAGAEDRVTLYTGNDDHILLDLVTPWRLMRSGEPVTVRIKGGLLGHWSVWVRRAVELLERAHAAAEAAAIEADFLALDSQITDCNAALFDVANDFRGCIAGCHEVLRRQGLMRGIWCLDPEEGLSPGQAAEIDRVSAAYPHLTDDDFVRANLARWLA